jgi:UrcA family protein
MTPLDRNVRCDVLKYIRRADAAFPIWLPACRFHHANKLETEMRKTFGGFGAALLILLPGAAMPAWAAPESEQITVDGPYTVRQEVTKRGMGGELAEQNLSVSQNVGYSDLDLTKHADVEKLRDRVKTAAKDTCRELDRRFPVSTYIPVTSRSCARDAARDGLAKVDAVAAKSVASADRRQTLARQDTSPLQ